MSSHLMQQPLHRWVALTLAHKCIFIKNYPIDAYLLEVHKQSKRIQIANILLYAVYV